MTDIILKTKGINKSFGPTRALNSVDFELRRGEVHGLIGENGSGKSTLSSIIAGIQSADSGEISYLGSPYSAKSVIEAQKQGISMIVQEMGTVPSISVAENIFLGSERSFARFGLIDGRAMRAKAQDALRDIGVGDIHAGAPAGALDPESRKLVEIARAMRTSPELLIIDETTTALTQDGRSILYDCVEKMRADNKGVLIISHDLEEIMSVCSVLTVLRDGVIIGTLTRDEFEPERIKAMMVGREITGNFYRGDYDGGYGDEVVLRADHLTGGWMIEDMSLELHNGEILGIGGIASGGVHELGRLMFGIDRAVLGEVRLGDGTKITGPMTAVRHQLGYVSKNRDEEAVMPSTSIRNNIVLPSLARLAKSGVFISNRSEKALTAEVIESMSVKCSSAEQPVRSLSGGNKQKVSFGKWLGCGARILILDCPTRGIDVGVKQAMYQLIYGLKKKGYSFILISEELPELIGMSDRILILKNGRINGEFTRSETLSEHDLIRVMV